MKNMQKRVPNDSHFRVLDWPLAGDPVDHQRVTHHSEATRGKGRKRRTSSE
jgi:hypothetical protein